MSLWQLKTDSAKWMNNLYKLYFKVYPFAPSEHISVLRPLMEAAQEVKIGCGCARAQPWTSAHNWAL